MRDHTERKTKEGKKVDQEKKPANKKTQSPEKLNEYIRIGSPGGLLFLAGLVMLAAAAIVWGFIGRIPITAVFEGAVMERESSSHLCISFVDIDEFSDTISVGNSALIKMADGSTYTGEIEYVGKIPLSAEEIRKYYGLVLSDWVQDNLLEDSRYCYDFTVRTQEDISEYWHKIVSITVVLREVKPISYLLG